MSWAEVWVVTLDFDAPLADVVAEIQAKLPELERAILQQPAPPGPPKYIWIPSD